MRGLLWSVPLALLMAGCSDTNTTGSQDAKADEEPAATVFDPMTGTMDRAAAVGDISAGRKDELDSAIDGSD